MVLNKLTKQTEKKCPCPQEGHSLAGDRGGHRVSEDAKLEPPTPPAAGGCEGRHRKEFLLEMTLAVMSSKLRRAWRGRGVGWDNADYPSSIK